MDIFSVASKSRENVSTCASVPKGTALTAFASILKNVTQNKYGHKYGLSTLTNNVIQFVFAFLQSTFESWFKNLKRSLTYPEA